MSAKPIITHKTNNLKKYVNAGGRKSAVQQHYPNTNRVLEDVILVMLTYAQTEKINLTSDYDSKILAASNPSKIELKLGKSAREMRDSNFESQSFRKQRRIVMKCKPDFQSLRITKQDLQKY